MTWQLDINGGETPHEHVVGVAPGDKCPTCERRLPHPRQATSPTTKPLAYRIPLDEYDAHLEVIDAVADLLGVTAEKYHRYRTMSYCLAAVLQGARLEETGG